MELKLIPHREPKPRATGVTMVMDKGLGLRQAEDLADTAGHLIDFLKLGFGTSYVSQGVREKVSIYQNRGIKVYVGGTLFEAFLVRGQLEDYFRYIDRLGVDAAEVSDGSMKIPHEEKCGHISRLARERTVLSEVGAKDAGVVLDHRTWVAQMNAELTAGSSFVIGEARESGTVGIFESSGKADTSLIDDITGSVPPEKILWEAPLKPQQVWFIKRLGPLVNLGNISPADILPLETLRLGLRGDTFFDVLPAEFQHLKL
jgi:phosphosulfolactate synthase